MTSTRTSITLTGLAIVLTLSGFAYIVQAEEELTPRERFLEMQENAQEKKEDFEATQQERKEEFEGKKEERQEQMEEKREEFKGASEERKEEMLEKREERKEALQERTQERIANLAANVSNRMDAAITRIQQIIDRFQERMNTLAERGADITDAQAALDESSGHLDTAASLVSNIDTLVAEVVASESPREAWAGTRETYKEITGHIKAAHASLRTALTLLKEAVADAELTRGVSGATANENTSADGAQDDDSTAEQATE